MQIDVEEIVKEAVGNLQASDVISVSAPPFNCELFKHNAEIVLANHPLFVVGAAMEDTMLAGVVRTLIGFTFEVGRLYGRSEVVRETMEGMK